MKLTAIFESTASEPLGYCRSDAVAGDIAQLAGQIAGDSCTGLAAEAFVRGQKALFASAAAAVLP